MLDAALIMGPVSYLKGFLYGLLLGAIYYPTSKWLVGHHWALEDFGYGYIIPFVVLYLIWKKKTELTNLTSISSWNGIFAFGTGILFFWLGELAGEYFIQYISFWLLLFGLCWLHLGWKKLKIILFPFLFMLSMFPPPDFIYSKISVMLKLISSQIGVSIIRFYGMSVHREGNIIDLGFTQLHVVDACSGLRYLFPLIVLGILTAYFFKAACWKKVVLVISTIPISIAVNGIRIALVGILYQFWGRAVAEGFFHNFSGWFIFMFSLGVLFLEMWGLRKIFPEKASSVQSSKLKVEGKETEAGGQRPEFRRHKEAIQNSPVKSSATYFTGQAKLKIKKFFLSSHFIVAVILLVVTLVLSQGVEFREKISINKSFSKFPMKVGEWSGTRQTMEQKFIDALDLSDYILVDYQNPIKQNVNLYVAYYESQRKGASIHSPATCLPGGGWMFHQVGETEIPVSNESEDLMPVNRAFIQKGNFRQLTYYWFPMRGRLLTNAYQMKIYNFWDALTRQRTDGALVRMITQVYENEELEDAEKRLQGFIKEIVPVLDEFLPKE